MRVFIDFWKLETEKKYYACFHWLLKTRNWKKYFVCFQFPSQIEFWEQFLFSIHFGLPNKFFSLKNRNLFLKIENKRKKQLPNIPLEIRLLCFAFNFANHQHARVQENPQGSKGDNEIALSNISFSLSF